LREQARREIHATRGREGAQQAYRALWITGHGAVLRKKLAAVAGQSEPGELKKKLSTLCLHDGLYWG
jgi:hypothetical protein